MTPGASDQRPDVRRLHGASVVIDSGHVVPGAAIHLAGGAVDDSGAGHVLEHMVFRGPAAGEGGDLYAALMSAGPLHDLNAATPATQTTDHLASATAEGRDGVRCSRTAAGGARSVAGRCRDLACAGPTCP